KEPVEFHAADGDILRSNAVDLVVPHTGGKITPLAGRMGHAAGAGHVARLLQCGAFQRRIGGQASQSIGREYILHKRG
ncbi:hypothetical protein Ga0451573_004014, partial [Peptococcaceae bacterium DYL19]|nr:hypothetical protein [Phosphitispora fastidiosa]